MPGWRNTHTPLVYLVSIFKQVYIQLDKGRRSLSAEGNLQLSEPRGALWIRSSSRYTSCRFCSSKMPEQLRTLKGGESKEVVNQDDDDSDWEYEYHETEMEVYQSLCNGVLHAEGHPVC